MSWSKILLIAGGVVLLAGAVLSICGVEPWANYVLIAGAVIIIIRGAVRVREKDDKSEKWNHRVRRRPRLLWH